MSLIFCWLIALKWICLIIACDIVLATEGDSWLKSSFDVVDVYMNSHVTIAEYGTSKTQKASTKFSGAPIAMLKLGKRKVQYPRPVAAGRRKVSTCWECGELGHNKHFRRQQAGKSNTGNAHNAQKATAINPMNAQVNRASLMPTADRVEVDCASSSICVFDGAVWCSCIPLTFNSKQLR